MRICEVEAAMIIPISISRARKSLSYAKKIGMLEEYGVYALNDNKYFVVIVSYDGINPDAILQLMDSEYLYDHLHVVGSESFTPGKHLIPKLYNLMVKYCKKLTSGERASPSGKYIWEVSLPKLWAYPYLYNIRNKTIIRNKEQFNYHKDLKDWLWALDEVN